MSNTYSPTWFQLFLETRPFTAQELAFIVRQLPNPPYRKLLDLCCGQGRHANPLARQGYSVLGLDFNAAALEIARRDAPAEARDVPQVRYIHADMTDLDQLPEQFDAILSIWQSFGYFDAAGNTAMLHKISRRLNPHGRLLLDIYQRSYWEQHQGVRQFERRGVQISLVETVAGNRLTARLDYGAHGGEVFEWQLYTPEEICQLAQDCQLRCMLQCSQYDEHTALTPDMPMMQLVFERQR